MNRRGFFKTITGFVAGLCAACVPGKAKTDAEIFGESADFKCDKTVKLTKREPPFLVYTKNGIFWLYPENEILRRMSLDMAMNIDKMIIKEIKG